MVTPEGNEVKALVSGANVAVPGCTRLSADPPGTSFRRSGRSGSPDLSNSSPRQGGLLGSVDQSSPGSRPPRRARPCRLWLARPGRLPALRPVNRRPWPARPPPRAWTSHHQPGHAHINLVWPAPGPPVRDRPPVRPRPAILWCPGLRASRVDRGEEVRHFRGQDSATWAVAFWSANDEVRSCGRSPLFVKNAG